MAVASSFFVNLVWPLCYFRMQGLTKYLFTVMFVCQCIISIVYSYREVNGQYDGTFEYNLNLLFL